jgi:hypothetical protein
MTAPADPRAKAPSPYSYTPPKDDTPKVLRWARMALTLVLIPISISAFRHEYGQVPLLSGINLAIHEFGHMLFMPFGIELFGETGVILGGALTQVLIPLVFTGYFLFGKQEHRDRHAAAVCFWWAAINVLSVAVYAGDARAGQLMLITGATGEDDPGSHDFYNLFARWGVLNRDLVYAARLRALAAFMCFVSIGVGIWAAYNSGRDRPNAASPEPRASGHE